MVWDTKKIILFAAVFFIIMVRSVIAEDCGGAITCHCGDTLTSSYNMTSDLTGCPEHGLIIAANDITLDCNGHLIDGDNNGVHYGIYYLFGNNRTTIKNCNVGEFYYGIYLNKSSNNNLSNIYAHSNTGGIGLFSSQNNVLTNITADINNWYGIYLYSSSNNILKDSMTSLNTNEGIYLYSSSNNQLTNITANQNNYRGIVLVLSKNNTLTDIFSYYSGLNGINLYSSSDNNTFSGITTNSNNNIGIHITQSSNNHFSNVTNKLNNNAGINFEYSPNNTFTGITTNSNKYGIALAMSSNNKFTGFAADGNEYGVYFSHSAHNNIFHDGHISSTTFDIYFLWPSQLNNTLTNVSYDSGKEYVENDSQLIRKWYYRAFVNDNLGNNVSNASVTAYNRTGDYNFNLTTGSTGYTALGEIIDYINNGRTRTFSSNYTISATKPLYRTESHNVNASLGNNYKDVFTLFTTEVSACGDLVLANAIYTLQNNISTNGTCFIILANNITLDLNGFRITGDDTGTNDYGVYVEDYDYTTIKNGEIYDFYYGIFLNKSSNNQLTGITANSNKYGIQMNKYLATSSNNQLTNIITNSNSYYGILISSSSNNILTNIAANSNNFRGIELDSSSNNILTNITSNNNTKEGILISGGSNNQLTGINIDGITLFGSSNNTLTGITANSKNYGIYLAYSSNNNIFQDGNISSNALYDVYLHFGLELNSINNTFTNVSYNVSKELVDSGSQLIRKWYYRAFVNDNLGNNVNNASVTAYNRTVGFNFNLTTDSTGYSPLAEILDYINNGGMRTYSSNYTIYASNSSYLTQNHGFNASLGNNLKDVFTLITTTTTTTIRRGGGGCPILKVYQDNKLVTIGKLNIHSPEDQDTITASTFTMQPKDGKYEIILDEAAYLFWDGSHINSVRLTDETGNECNLISATHSTQGDVLSAIAKSDDLRVRSYPGDRIKLVYDECSGNKFTFSIEGYNMKCAICPPI